MNTAKPTRLRLLPLAAALAAAPALAADADTADTLSTITVTATRIATPVIDAPATVSVITAEDIDDRLHLAFGLGA